MWCNRIKRVDGVDGLRLETVPFFVTNTFWIQILGRIQTGGLLRQGAVPSLNRHGAQKLESSQKSPTKHQVMPSSASASLSLPEYTDEERASVSYYT